MRPRLISKPFGVLLITAALTGCVVAPDSGTYENHAGYGTSYRSYDYSGTTLRRYDDVYRPDPYHRSGAYRSPYVSGSDHQGAPSQANRHDARRAAGNLRDWRDGDAAFRRNQRELGGVGLERRQRLDRQERLREARQERADQARVRHGSGQLALPNGSDQAISEKFDQDVGRRLQRSTQAEREAQSRAREVRRQLLADRQAESE
jgi:hypothetical protein